MTATHSAFLTVLPNDEGVHLCMYGSENPKDWPGDTCESNDIAKYCKKFSPRIPASHVVQEFQQMLRDDKFVSEHLKDIAILQWILEERVHAYPLGFLERVSLYIKSKFIKSDPAINSLPPARDADDRFGGSDDSDENPGA
jgi:hypothetical protein